MTFISYAKNFEDVILWRALKHLNSGFYIDVGANDPYQDSATKAFYDRSWRGINIEPVAEWFEKLSMGRLRDINLQLAAGAKPNETILYEIPQTRFSTTDKAIAERHESQGGYTKIEKKVSVRTITDICEEYHIALIHFLKIGVKGAEKKVLQGVDFSKIRPWIVLVEATLPDSPIPCYENWESILLSSDYQFAYFDGLNRFYVAKECPQIKEKIHTPPNCFDDFRLAQTQLFCKQTVDPIKNWAKRAEAQTRETMIRAERAAAQTREATIRAEHAEAQAQKATIRAKRAETLLHRLHHSKYWRITFPLRQFGKYSRWFARGSKAWLRLAPGSRPRRVLKKMLMLFKAYVDTKPRLKIGLIRLLNNCPQVRRKLNKLLTANQKSPVHFERFTSRAQMIYRQLKDAIEKNQKTR